METITHNNLPEAVSKLFQRLDSIEAILLNQEHQPLKDKQEFLTLKQVCELTGYAAPTIYGLIGKNAIPHNKRGQRLFFEREAIIAWIKAGKRKTKLELEAEADNQLQGANKRK